MDALMKYMNLRLESRQVAVLTSNDKMIGSRVTCPALSCRIASYPRNARVYTSKCTRGSGDKVGR